MEPLLENFPQFSTYNYGLNNPTRIFDDDGKWPREGSKFHITTASDIKESFNEIVERIGLGYEKLLSGDIEGSYQQMKSNILDSPNLLLGLIPGDFTTDFVFPLGLAKNSGNVLKLTEGLTLKEQAIEIRDFIGKNRVTMPEGTLDLFGKSHAGIETPHFKPLIIQEHKGSFFTKTLPKLTRSATKEDLNNAVNFINKVMKADIELMKTKF